MTKEKPPDFSGGFFVAESIELCPPSAAQVEPK